MQKTLTVSAALAALAVLAGSASAQTPPPPPPAHHGIFSKIFHPHAKPGQPALGGMTPTHGGVVANKNSHVYHLPGDKGALPAAQNRVYFPTAAAAEAAGYHRAGSARGTMGRHPMMQGAPTHGMPMHDQTAPGGMTR